jgi:catabolite regulation protein CreA
MWQFIKTIFVVTIVTCIVWLYAESENVKAQALDVDIQFVAPPGRQLVIRPAQPRRVRLVMRCAASQFAEVERVARNGPILLDVRHDPADNDPREVIVLKDRLAKSAPFSNLGISLTEVQPATLQINVEELQKVTLPVEVISNDVQVTAVADPAKVEIEVPASLVKALADGKVEARLDPKVLSRLPLNVPHTLDVPLSPPDWLRAAGVSVDLPSAKVTLKIGKQAERFIVPLVPVLVMGPPTELARFSVVLGKDNLFLHDIALTGPSDAIDRIRKSEIRVTAYLPLTADELEKGVTKESISAVPVMTLPPGVTPVEALPAVGYKITRKEPQP